MPPHLTLALALLFGLSPAVSGASVRCDLATPSQTATSCLDPASLKGRTVVVPSNVTRIGKDGLALCASVNQQKISSDIVYVIDNSTSMVAWGYWVSADGQDTSWYTPGCSNSANVSGTPLLRPRHRAGGEGWDTVQRITGKNKPSCDEAKDPYSMRAEAVRQALLFHAAFDSTSRAGVLQFNGQVRSPHAMRDLRAANLAFLQDTVGLIPAISGTNWFFPLDTALRWLERDKTTRSQAIILISDGEPNQYVEEYRRLVGRDGAPPIYGVYLGSPAEKTPELDFVTSSTGGTKFVVPPDRPDSLQGVINSIVAQVTSRVSLSSGRIGNLTNGQWSRALTLDDESSRTRLGLDSILALGLGNNQIQLITSTGKGGAAQWDTTRFVIQVGGPDAPLGITPLAGSAFETQCHPASSVSWRDSAWNQIPWTTEEAGRVGLLLAPSGESSLPLAVVATSGAGDREPLQLGTLDSVAAGAWGRLLPLSVARLSPAVASNRVLDVRGGVDTLRASWCHPRDGRDCAAGTLEVRSFREASLLWVPQSVPGPAGTLILQARLPGQKTASVQADLYRHGVRIGGLVLSRSSDSLYRDTVVFLQGPRRPGGDTLWMAAPKGAEDSLVATLVWGLDGRILSDTALVVRPPLSLALEWTGVGQQVVVRLQGGQPDARKEFPVRLSVDPRSRVVALDSSRTTQVDATSLAAGSPGASVAILGRFVDPLYGDTAWASVVVPVPKMSLVYTIGSSEGPVGSLALRAELPGVTGAAVQVGLLRRGRSIGTATLLRQPDSSFAGSFPFRQGPIRPGPDSVWLVSPNAFAPDSIVALYIHTVSGDTLSDTGLVRRPAFALDLRSPGGTVVAVALVGGSPDARGVRTVQIDAVETRKVVLDASGEARTDVLAPLSKVAGSRALVRGWFVDPVYGDTARDTTWIDVPVRTLRFVEPAVDGPRGLLRLELSDPWTSADTRTVVVAHGRDSQLVRMVRAPSGIFAGEVAFAQSPVAMGDTLRLGRPVAGTDSVFAVLPRMDSLPTLVDRALVLRPPLRLVMVADGSRPQLVRLQLSGGNPDARGEAHVFLEGPVAIPATSMTRSGSLSWEGEQDLAERLPESLQPVRIRAWFVDPVYGDTAWATLQVVSPWFPGTVVATPDRLDPRRPDTVEIRVRDKDPDSTRAGTVFVQVGSERFALPETGSHTGEYVLRLPASKLDPRWGDRSPRTPWRVELVYVDPDHPEDVARTFVEMEFNVPSPTLAAYGGVQPAPEHASSPRPVLWMVPAAGDGTYPGARQGVELRIWEPTKVAVYLYDNLGVAVGSWEGVLWPRDAETSADYLIAWDGRDAHGNPTSPGVYLARAVLLAMDGQYLGNRIFRIGRK